MRYIGYDALVVQYGIHLAGFTEPSGICSIEKINTASQLQWLCMALNNGTCHWEQLMPEDWEARKAAYEARVAAGEVGQCTPCKDKGVPCVRSQHVSEMADPYTKLS